MTSHTATAAARLTRDDTGRLFGQTMGLVALTAALFALGAYLARELSGGRRDGTCPHCARVVLGARRADRLRDRATSSTSSSCSCR